MHIPDGFLDPKVSIGMMGAAVAALGFCLSKVKTAVTAVVPSKALAAAGNGASNIALGSRRTLSKLGEQKVYRMGMIASLIFAAQMFDFTIMHGTSGHIMGGLFASVILGPFAGTLVLAVVLFIQAIFFADGGLMALGANIVNMAVIGSLICYYIYYFLKRSMPEWQAIGISAWLSVVLASLSCGAQIAMSGAISLGEIIPAMLKVYAYIGVVEAIITVAMVNIFRKIIIGAEKNDQKLF